MAKEKRMVTGYSPKEHGCQLISIKQRPNYKCRCKSGKKAKHCCGTETKYLSAPPTGSYKPKTKTQIDKQNSNRKSNY